MLIYRRVGGMRVLKNTWRVGRTTIISAESPRSSLCFFFHHLGQYFRVCLLRTRHRRNQFRRPRAEKWPSNKFNLAILDLTCEWSPLQFATKLMSYCVCHTGQLVEPNKYHAKVSTTRW